MPIILIATITTMGIENVFLYCGNSFKVITSCGSFIEVLYYEFPIYSEIGFKIVYLSHLF